MLSTNENTALPITLSATDADGDSLTYAITGGPAHGTLTPTGNGAYTYTPALNYHGADAFAFTASDGSNTSNPAVVAIAVLDSSAPVAAGTDGLRASSGTTQTAGAALNTPANFALIVNAVATPTPPGLFPNDGAAGTSPRTESNPPAAGGTVLGLGGAPTPSPFTRLDSGGGETLNGAAEAAAFWPWLQEFSTTSSPDGGASPAGGFWPSLQELTPNHTQAVAPNVSDGPSRPWPGEETPVPGATEGRTGATEEFPAGLWQSGTADPSADVAEVAGAWERLSDAMIRACLPLGNEAEAEADGRSDGAAVDRVFAEVT